ncbi:ATP-binding protein [Lactobacillus xujianguonis]|uniref:AAA family ATPase n=1 Tax=Lactobacillus TaxID=1578 RepID=UPI0026C53E91
MFIGRKDELASLNEHYQNNEFEFAVIYGRRRMGKTTLISKFVEDKDVICFTAMPENKKSILQRMSRAVAQFEDPEINAAPMYRDFDQLLDRVAALAKKQRLVFVIDEYPYLAESFPGFSSLLQAYIDRVFKKTQLFLILCGSSMSFMEKQVLGYQSPLYGRRTLQLKIEPFNFQEAQEMLPQFNKQDAFAMYAISGGIP